MKPHLDQVYIEIRLASPADASSIAAVLSEAFIEYLPLYTAEGFAATTPSSEQILKRVEEGEIWIASREGAIVGTASVVERGESLYIRGMGVLPQARGHRVGETLLEEIERFALERSHKRLFLSTTPFLHRAINLYRRFGFMRTDEGPHDLFGTPLFTMEKLLTGG